MVSRVWMLTMIVFMFHSLSPIGAAPVYRALIVGMERTAKGATCSSCGNDAQNVQTLLPGEAEKTVYLNEQATRNAVLQAIDDLARDSKPEDFVFIYFSGHGGQVYDSDHDEEDRLDETWVVYDGQLVDDEIRAKWPKFAKGVRLFIVGDSCHSASSIKAADEQDAADYRTKDVPLSPEMYERWYKDYKENGFSDEFPVEVHDENDTEASLLYFGACEDAKTARMGIPNSAFTGALIRQMKTASTLSASMTYAVLFERVKNEVASDSRFKLSPQVPQMMPYGESDPGFYESVPFAFPAAIKTGNIATAVRPDAALPGLAVDIVTSTDQPAPTAENPKLRSRHSSGMIHNVVEGSVLLKTGNNDIISVPMADITSISIQSDSKIEGLRESTSME